MKKRVAPDEIIKLAAMECAASCITTALNLFGCDYRYFLLGYWNLTYYAGTLMSGKHVRQLDLESVFGIQKTLHAGSAVSLRESLDEQSIVLMLCHASKLDFFPRNELSLEAEGFQHYILIYGYDAVSKQYLIIDPIADYIGGMTEEALYASSVREDLRYYRLVFPTDRQQPDHLAIIRMETERNLSCYTLDEANAEGNAIDQFSIDLTAMAERPVDERNAWIDRNNISISSVIKSRGLIGEIYRSFHLLEEEDLRHYASSIDQIIKLWTTVNFLLIKFKRNPAQAGLTDSIRQRLEAVKALEKAFLDFLHLKGRERIEV
ncbi:hypothetical protein PaecuDRAFT_0843 [Paenibacillus curdlanolyticus YK9]|uniref:Butirosin biosynthesis protein H N-terminal domain-containing protein n=1 Tax=Paenibacillus curdlanolyticus YK9 TaxID=717606 RepID=E0I5C1_9BACL|nr:hypothetical protein [Paenibacillus curdlanolyticus]EFM12163.1 hypothetical protein PaecuDRAFT_0843 [Paenibacillus curdlanolyticus YK9]